MVDFSRRFECENLTAGWGRKNQTQLRYVYLGDNKRSPESKALPNNEAWLLSAEHDVSKATGYYRLDPKSFANPTAPTRLIYADKMIGGVVKAKDSERILFTQQSFTEFPDLWSSDLSFVKTEKISRLIRSKLNSIGARRNKSTMSLRMVKTQSPDR